MLGAIAGDIIGSIYEFDPIKTKDFPLFGAGTTFTDDTVCTVAVAECILQEGDFATFLKGYGRRYPGRGYGSMFARWLASDDLASYGSFGNGAAMRVSPVAWLARDEPEALELARRSAAATHDHPRGIAGAEATALAMWRAREGAPPESIRSEVAARFGYDLDRSVEGIRKHYWFNETCDGTVPEALVCALEATGYEDAVRNAISLGGDADTLACITGGLAELLYGLPEHVAEQAKGHLDPELQQQVARFYAAAAKTY
jgi:ADP-ribosyl-[dinitrogen reductase] hydrolase